MIASRTERGAGPHGIGSRVETVHWGDMEDGSDQGARGEDTKGSNSAASRRTSRLSRTEISVIALRSQIARLGTTLPALEPPAHLGRRQEPYQEAHERKA